MSTGIGVWTLGLNKAEQRALLMLGARDLMDQAEGLELRPTQLGEVAPRR